MLATSYVLNFNVEFIKKMLLLLLYLLRPSMCIRLGISLRDEV